MLVHNTQISVYVLNKSGKPMMTCSPAKARKLLEAKKAKVVRTNIFTIKLLYGSAGYKQPIVGGCDTGSKVAAFAATANNVVIYCSEVKLRNDVHKKMEQRAMYRRNRRGRKVRHRQPRFDNRTRPEGWLTPSLRSKVESHLREKRFMESILPISSWKVETAEFDIHKIKNIEVSGVGYQNGPQKDFYNTKQYVYWRDGYECQHCKGKSKDKRLHAHHIVFRSNGGTDAPDNLIALCETCHGKLHSGEFLIKPKKVISTKHATEVSIVKSALKRSGWIFEETFGYETKFKREQVLRLPKTHCNDAIAICLSEGEIVDLPVVVLQKRHVSKGDYQLTKGERGEKKIPVGKLFGLRKHDLISTSKGVGFVKGKRSSGAFALEDIRGNKITDSVSVKKDCQRISARTTTMTQKEIY